MRRLALRGLLLAGPTALADDALAPIRVNRTWDVLTAPSGVDGEGSRARQQKSK